MNYRYGYWSIFVYSLSAIIIILTKTILDVIKM